MNTKNYDNEISKEYSYSQKSNNKSKKPKILIITPEITELPTGLGNAANLIAAKGGGLGDISAGLVSYLVQSKKYDIHIALPKYDYKIRKSSGLSNSSIDKLTMVLQRRGIHLVNDSAFSYLHNPYSDNSIHKPIERSLAFQRYIINNLLNEIQPDVIHCNDWMTGLIPAAAKAKNIKSLFTLHNIFTEKESLYRIEKSGIRPLDFLNNLYFEKFPANINKDWKKHFKTNPIDFTASAILSCDYFNTVSQTFLEEIIDGSFLDLIPKPIFEMIKNKHDQNRACGILNAPQNNIDPEFLNGIYNFTVKDEDLMKSKLKNKAKFQKKMNLPIELDTPLFFWPNRLYDQKGPDLLLDHLDSFVKKFNAQFAFVADGHDVYEKKLKALASKHKNIVFKNFDEKLSTLGKVGSDFILMPSRYEPCGLPQMESMRFGTLPIVRSTGGLKDSVQQLDLENETGNGFLFEIFDHYGLEYGITEAMKFYNLPEKKKIRIIRNVIKNGFENYNLKKTAKKYMKIYNMLIKEKMSEKNEN